MDQNLVKTKKSDASIIIYLASDFFIFSIFEFSIQKTDYQGDGYGRVFSWKKLLIFMFITLTQLMLGNKIYTKKTYKPVCSYLYWYLAL